LNSINKTCQLCGHEILKEFHIPMPLFRHLDFSTTTKIANFFKCNQCSIIQNAKSISSEISSFKKLKYANSQQTSQKIKDDRFNRPVKRSYLQAKILSENFDFNNCRILDIGCFDGNLLYELDKKISKSQLWGFDINPNLQRLFPKKQNFHFVSSDYKKITGKFDLIIFSHSILYISNISKIIDLIKQLLNQNGILYIQIPDINKNPYYALMGDQYFIFTKISLTNFLHQSGFNIDIIELDYFPRELLLIGKKNRSHLQVHYLKDNLFEKNIEILNSIKLRLEKSNDKELAVLGTTINAAFVDEIIGHKINYFVDENIIREKTFRGKKVVHPKDLDNSISTILPYGESGLKIKKRFQKLYKGKYNLI